MALATVGEQTGMLPEVFRELEKYFQLQLRLRRQFLSQIAWPAFQLFAAIFVVAGLIWILGLLGQAPTTPSASAPAATGRCCSSARRSACSAASWACTWWPGASCGRGRSTAGCCACRWSARVVQALAVTRFCLALRLTLETAMPIARALRLSFRATGNAAFEAASDTAQKSVKAGEELTAALAKTRLFPEEFQHVIAVGEESGRLTEVLEQQGEQYAEESERRLKVLATTAGWGVWLVVAGIIIFCIFRIALSYVGMIDEAARF